MKKTFAIMLAAMMLIVCFAACNNGTNNDNPNVPEPTAEVPVEVTPEPTEEPVDPTLRLTKEYLFSHSDLTEEDFEGVDFEQFVDTYELTVGSMQERSVRLLLEKYKFDKNLDEYSVYLDYTYILNMNQIGRISEEEYDHISAIVWEYSDGTESHGMIIDFLKGEAYSMPEIQVLQYVKGELQNAKAFVLDDQKTAALMEYIAGSGISAENPEYDGDAEGNPGQFSWKLAFNLEDGYQAVYVGHGSVESGTPKTINDFIKYVTDLVTAPAE